MPSLDPRSWPYLYPVLIAHDVGGSRDRSTAVVGGYCRYVPGPLGITEFLELPQGLYGSARASTLAQIDARYDRNALIFADLSNDSSYGEQLLETFGPRVIGVHISRHGNGMEVERRPVGRWQHTDLPCWPLASAGSSAQRFASEPSLLCRWAGGAARLCPTGSPRAGDAGERDRL